MAIVKLVMRGERALSLGQAILALSIALPIAACSGITYSTTPTPQGKTVTVDGNTTYQTISGWGASTGYNEQNNNLTAAQADCFFSTSNGSCATGNSIGLEWIRIQDNAIPNSAPDLPTLQLAVARGAQVLLGFNGPPLNTGSYAGQASYMVGKIQYFQSNGVPISYVAVINEPQDTGTTAAAIDTFVASYLHPALVSSGLTSIQITLPESADWFVTDYLTPCMQDANCASYVSAVSGHEGFYGQGSQGADGFAGGWGCCVDFAAVPVPSSAAGKPVWQTEISGGASGPCSVDSYLANFDSSMAPDAITWAYNIHMFLTEVSGSAWFYWNLAAETVNGPTACNDGLTDQSNQPTKRFYAIGNWSRFVRSGWVEIAATANPQSGVYVTAFMNQSNGAFAIVAINQNTSSIQQIFTLSGLSANSLTPWITSSSLNLASQSSVSVLGSNFTYTLPAQSITTFVSGGGSSPAFSSRPAH